MTAMPCLFLSISFKTSKMKTIFSGGRKSVEFIAGAGGHQVLPGEMSTTGDEGRRAAVEFCAKFSPNSNVMTPSFSPNWRQIISGQMPTATEPKRAEKSTVCDLDVSLLRK